MPFNHLWTDLHTPLEAHSCCVNETSVIPTPQVPSPPREPSWHLLIYFCVLFQHLEDFSSPNHKLRVTSIREREGKGEPGQGRVEPCRPGDNSRPLGDEGSWLEQPRWPLVGEEEVLVACAGSSLGWRGDIGRQPSVSAAGAGVKPYSLSSPRRYNGVDLQKNLLVTLRFLQLVCQFSRTSSLSVLT